MVLALTLFLLAGWPEVVAEALYDGPESLEDKCAGMVTGPDGAVYLTGYSLGRETDFDFATVRFSAAGSTGWARRYGAPLGNEDRSWLIARDSGGGIVVAGGSVENFAHGWDFVLIRYLPDGDTAWLRRLDFPPSADDKPTGLAVGPNGDIYVTGRSRNRPDSSRMSDWDIVAVRMTADGDTVWTRRFDGPPHKDDQGAGVAVDAEGCCFVAGKATLEPPGTDIVLLKYGPDGDLVWERDISGAESGNDMAVGVLTDADGRCYLYGAIYDRAASFDYFTACFDRDGEELWRQSADCSGSVDIPQAACFTPDGGICVTGQSTGEGSSFDILTVKYSAEGELLWARRYNGPGNGADRGWCIAPGQDGTVFVGGTSVGSMGHPDMLLACYSPGGDSVLWTYRRASAGLGETRPVALGLADGSPSGPGLSGERLVVGGFTMRAESGSDFLLLWIELDVSGLK
jgi:uncharacterized delta-60 repeat protein